MAKPENRIFTPRSILKKGMYPNKKYRKKQPSQQRVNFSSTEMESSDTASEVEDQCARGGGVAASDPAVRSKNKTPSASSSKNGGGGAGGNIDVDTNLTKRTLRSNPGK